MSRRALRLVLGLLAGALLGVAALAGALEADGPAPSASGAPDLDRYCRSVYGSFSAAHLLSPSADGWHCSTVVGGIWSVVPVEVAGACRAQFGSASHAEVGSVQDPRSWRCER